MDESNSRSRSSPKFEVVSGFEHLFSLLGEVFCELNIEVACFPVLDCSLKRSGLDSVEQHAAGPARLCCRGEVPKGLSIKR